MERDFTTRQGHEGFLQLSYNLFKLHYGIARVHAGKKIALLACLIDKTMATVMVLNYFGFCVLMFMFIAELGNKSIGVVCQFWLLLTLRLMHGDTGLFRLFIDY